VELAPPRPNVEQRVDSAGEPVVVFVFPYDRVLVDAMRAIPGRRFDWVEREWSVPQHEVTAVYVADVLARFPSLLASDDVLAWLASAPSGWLGRVDVRKGDGEGEFVLRTLAGELAPELREHATAQEDEREFTMPFTQEAADALLEEAGARMERAALGCATRLQVGIRPPRAELVVAHSVEEARLGLEPLWDPDALAAFVALPGAEPRSRTLPIDAWVIEPLEGFLRTHDVAVSPGARPTLTQLRAEHDVAVEQIRRSRAKAGDPIERVAERLGGELAPFQWAGVHYVLEARRTFLADEQGLGKTVQALAALEADDAWPAIVVCPASLKLTWEREAEKWLPHRTRSVVSGRGGALPNADLVIVNYEIVAAHRVRALGPRVLAVVRLVEHQGLRPRA
jgi:SWI/SNF-related matrix-associated actin-dependent regulator 1 of chromatin subfamily A